MKIGFPLIDSNAGKAFGLCLCLSALIHAGALASLPNLKEKTQPVPVSLEINLMSLAAPVIEPAKIEPASGEVKTPEIEIVSKPQAKEIITKPKPEPIKKQTPKPALKVVKKEKPAKAQPAQPRLTSNDRGAEKTTVIPLVKQANILKQTPPNYPPRARRMGQQGTVLLHALVGRDGHTQDLKIVSSSGYTSLDNSAINAVKTWTFVSARKDGRPMKAWVEVPVQFVLR